MDPIRGRDIGYKLRYVGVKRSRRDATHAHLVVPSLKKE